jgi:hypothetical protein
VDDGVDDPRRQPALPELPLAYTDLDSKRLRIGLTFVHDSSAMLSRANARSAAA